MEKENIQDNKVKSLINTSMEKIRSMIDVNCVIGNAMQIENGTTIIPVSKVSVGFVAGGGEYDDLNSKRNKTELPMAGGTGGGFSVTPVGFFVVSNNKFKLIRADKSSAYLDLIKNGTEVLKKFMENIK